MLVNLNILGNLFTMKMINYDKDIENRLQILR